MAETVVIELVILIDEAGNFTSGDDIDEVRERHEEQYGAPSISSVHRLKLTVPMPAETVHEGKIEGKGPIQLTLSKS